MQIKKSSPRLPSWQPSLIFFNIPIDSGSIIKPCTLKHFQVTYRLHKAGHWTILTKCGFFACWIKNTFFNSPNSKTFPFDDVIMLCAGAYFINAHYTAIRAWICNCSLVKLRNVLIHSCPNFNGGLTFGLLLYYWNDLAVLKSGMHIILLKT